MDPAKKAIIIHETAKGSTCRQIAAKVGVHYATVNDYQRELRSQIDKEMQEILTKGLAAARKTTVKFAEYGASEECIPGISDDKWAKLSHDASKTIIGIVTSSQPSTIINSLIQINQAPETAKEVSGLSAFIDAQWNHIETTDNNTVYTTIQPDHLSIQDETTSIPTSHTPAGNPIIPKAAGKRKALRPGKKGKGA